MKTVLITGSKGFIGKNLISALSRDSDNIIRTFDADDDPAALESHISEADLVYHLAGVNRPEHPEEFAIGNTHLTSSLVSLLEKSERRIPVLLTSSVQAALDNPYGKSKKAAEDILINYNRRTGAPIFLYRLPGVFGKWSRPNYNTVVATFCYNISHGLEIRISDPDKEIELVYIDDVVRHFLGHLTAIRDDNGIFYEISRTFRVTLGELSARIYKLRDMRKTLTVPDLSDRFMRCLHATYLSFLDTGDFSYPLALNRDSRGCLFELIKSEHFGQIFVSKTHRGIVRGDHYHDSKVEKFCILQGEAVIRFRNVLDGNIIEYHVSDENMEVVDIPPGYTHHIENTGDREMIVLFWANQIFDSSDRDTHFLQVNCQRNKDAGSRVTDR